MFPTLSSLRFLGSRGSGAPAHVPTELPLIVGVTFLLPCLSLASLNPNHAAAVENRETPQNHSTAASKVTV
jgi:hypothetical protein